MDRSTISDGFPHFPNAVGVGGVSETQTGHLSLDRKQVNRTSGSQSVPYGVSPGQLDTSSANYGGGISCLDSAPTTYYDPHFTYRPTPQSLGYPVSSNQSLPRDQSYDPYGVHRLQRSYSLRARSQPPPDANWQSLLHTPTAQVDAKPQWYPTQSGYPQSAAQVFSSNSDRSSSNILVLFIK